MKDFGGDQTVRLGGQHLKGNDLAVGTNYQLCSLAKLRSDVRVEGETFGGAGDPTDARLGQDRGLPNPTARPHQCLNGVRTLIRVDPSNC
jgi:hypothetical protein